MMLIARGAPAAAAETAMDRFYQQTPVGQTAAYGRFFTPIRPAAFRSVGMLFPTRIAYPLLAALLFPLAGISALILASLLAFITAAFGVYLCARTLARPWIAAGAALLFVADPEMQLLARSALTDMTSLAIWTLLLAVLLRGGPRRSAWRWFAAIAVLEIALIAARPLIYLPAGAALAAALFGVPQRMRDRFKPVFTLTVAVTIGYVITGTLVGTPGISDSVGWLYHRSIELQATPASMSFLEWYRHAVARTLVALARIALQSGLPLIALVAAVVLRSVPAATLLIGSVLGGLAAAPLNPDPFDVDRTLMAPLMPAVVLLVALGLERICDLLAVRRRQLPPAITALGAPVSSA
jgi:Dolichyl-phosphate-mannose-protein mannosyltransferase